MIDNLNTRKVLCWGFIGDNGSGKSVTARNLAIQWKKTRPNSLVASYDPTRVLSDITDISFDPDNVYDIIPGLKNTLVIFDEHRMTHPPDKVDQRFRDFFNMRRDNNIDIFYIVHNPSAIINFLTGFTNKYFIYYTQTLEGGFSRKIPNYMVCYKASMLINNYVTKFGDGIYPTFPYVVVDKKENNITTVNMSKNRIEQILK